MGYICFMLTEIQSLQFSTCVFYLRTGYGLHLFHADRDPVIAVQYICVSPQEWIRVTPTSC